jgi:hypothetical protein
MYLLPPLCISDDQLERCYRAMDKDLNPRGGAA